MNLDVLIVSKNKTDRVLNLSVEEVNKIANLSHKNA
jgi:hypothetical protein